jgi:hypothetical protein
MLCPAGGELAKLEGGCMYMNRVLSAAHFKIIDAILENSFATFAVLFSCYRCCHLNVMRETWDDFHVVCISVVVSAPSFPNVT